jgi:MFS superfamily sulfate permease-like transporter
VAWLFPSLRHYQPAWLRGDLIAGLTVWAVLVPESLAYASIAGVSPVVGLYAAPPALLFYALFGSSRHLIVGPMSATAALSAATVTDLVAPAGQDFAAFTAALAITTGVAALLAGILRRPENQLPDHATILRVEAGLFFANADVVRRELRRHAAEDHVNAIVLDAEAIPARPRRRTGPRRPALGHRRGSAAADRLPDDRRGAYGGWAGSASVTRFG